MSNLRQQELEERWYEEGYEVGELKGFEGLSLELFADSYVEMKRNIYERERIKNDSEDISFLTKYMLETYSGGKI